MELKPNTLFYCEALDLVERLPSETVSLVYLNPPWFLESYYEQKNQNSIKQSVDDYANYLAKIIQQVRRILTNDGSLFVHWSNISPLDVRLVMNQAFCAKPNYEITWKIFKRPLFESNDPINDNEFLLVYSKSESPTYNPIFRALTNEEKRKYILKDDRGLFFSESLISRVVRPSFQVTWHGYQPPKGSSWRYHPDKLEAFALENRIHFPSHGGMPTLKRYLEDNPGIEVGTTWEDIPSIIPSHERTGYMGQTPLALMERIIKLATNVGDQILDPFCGSGTTIFAAQKLGRNWWAADNSEKAHEIIANRLTKHCELGTPINYQTLIEEDILAFPIQSNSYVAVIANIDEIAKLHKEISDLSEGLSSLKKAMNIDINNEEAVESALKKMHVWITDKFAKQSESTHKYIDVVCAWLTGWESLNHVSQVFLPQAELLFDHITSSKGGDYAPFIIQYCRALENELLIKLFVAYTDDFYNRVPDVTDYLREDCMDNKTGLFAKMLKKRGDTYTLGNMSFILSLLKEDGETFAKSKLLQDFRAFAVRYFSEHIVEKEYIFQIDCIVKDFRNKAAHPHVLDFQAATECRDKVRACLNELIINYKGS